MMRRISVIGAGLMAGLGAMGLSGCSVQRPSGEADVCYQLTFPKDNTPTYVVVARNVGVLEDCAAQLEGIRINFLRMGGSIHEIQGAYNDQFIWVDVSGVSVSKTLSGPRYVLMARTPDGKLLRPGYTGAQPVEQPPPNLPPLH